MKLNAGQRVIWQRTQLGVVVDDSGCGWAGCRYGENCVEVLLAGDRGSTYVDRYDLTVIEDDSYGERLAVQGELDDLRAKADEFDDC